MFVVEAGDDIATRRSDSVVDDLYAVDDSIRYASVYPPASARARLWLIGVVIVQQRRFLVQRNAFRSISMGEILGLDLV